MQQFLVQMTDCLVSLTPCSRNVLYENWLDIPHIYFMNLGQLLGLTSELSNEK